jgi:hypothetical protein
MSDLSAIDLEPYKVGRYYRVPTVTAYLFDWLRPWPVLEPMHNDAEIIGFRYDHYHLDWRFVSERAFKSLERKNWYRSVLSIPLMTSERQNAQGLPLPVMRRLKCKRDMPVFPERAPFIGKLEDRYAPCRMKRGICPHQGVSLRSLPERDGVVECPAHGLRWWVKTGALARRGAHE